MWMISFSVTIQMKATEQYFPAVLFIIYAAQGGSNLKSMEKLLRGAEKMKPP